jgi:hypothetical protein
MVAKIQHESTSHSDFIFETFWTYLMTAGGVRVMLRTWPQPSSFVQCWYFMK